MNVSKRSGSDTAFTSASSRPKASQAPRRAAPSRTQDPRVSRWPEAKAAQSEAQTRPGPGAGTPPPPHRGGRDRGPALTSLVARAECSPAPRRPEPEPRDRHTGARSTGNRDQELDCPLGGAQACRSRSMREVAPDVTSIRSTPGRSTGSNRKVLRYARDRSPLVTRVPRFPASDHPRLSS